MVCHCLSGRSALQSVIGVRDVARRNNYYVDGLTHTWVSYYMARVSSSLAAINEWHQMEDVESHRPVELKLVSVCHKCFLVCLWTCVVRFVWHEWDMISMTSPRVSSRA